MRQHGDAPCIMREFKPCHVRPGPVCDEPMLNGREDPPAPKMWSWKRILACLIGMLIVFLTALLAYDEKLEPYDDLKPTRTEVPDARTNGYLMLKAAWENLPPIDSGRQWDNFQAGMLPWEDGLVSQLNPAGQDLQSDLSQALAAPRWVVPFMPPGSSIYEGSFSPLDQIRSLEAAAWRQLKEGDASGVQTLIRDLRALSKRQIKGSNQSGDLWLAFEVDMRAAVLTGNLLEELPPQAPMLRQLALLWSEDQLTPDDLRNPVAGDSEHLAVYLRNGQYMEDYGIDDFLHKLLTKLLTNPNATKNHIHRIFRILRTKGLTTEPSFQTSVFAELDRLRPAQKGAAAYLNANLAGSSIARQLISPAEYHYTHSTRLHLFQARAMRIALAIKMWQFKNGGVAPPAMTTLVPEYLPAIPSDPWDGSPIRWDASAQIVYVVGQDWMHDVPAFRGGRRNWIDLDPDSPGLRLVRPPYVPPPVPVPKKSTKPRPKSTTPAGKPSTTP